MYRRSSDEEWTTGPRRTRTRSRVRRSRSQTASQTVCPPQTQENVRTKDHGRPHGPGSKHRDGKDVELVAGKVEG